MENIIILKEKNVYGNDLLYPITFVQELEALTGKKTLNDRDITALKNMGFKVYREAEYWKACGKAMEKV